MNNVWLITEASRGLGLEIARAALAAGEKVMATACNASTVTKELGESMKICWWSGWM